MTARTQGQLAAHEPAARFIELLAAVLSSGKGHVAAPNGDVPPSPERWGWQRRDVGEELTWVPLTPQRIGWVDGEDLYLQPDAAYAAVRRLAQDEGDGVPLAPKTLWKRLDEKGLLASRDEDGRNLVRRTLGGDRRRVLHIAASTPEGPMAGKSGQSDQPGQSASPGTRGQRTDVGASPRSGPMSGPIITPSAQNRATESGQEPVAAGTDAPVGQERLPDWPDWPDSQDIVAAMVHSDVESF